MERLNVCHTQADWRWHEGLPRRSFVLLSCMPAGLLLGSFVGLITSPLWDTKPGNIHPSGLRVPQPPISPHRVVKVMAPKLGVQRPSSVTLLRPISSKDGSHGTYLNEAVRGTCLHSQHGGTVTLVALCLKEAM